jgi:hypothetical protein
VKSTLGHQKLHYIFNSEALQSPANPHESSILKNRAPKKCPRRAKAMPEDIFNDRKLREEWILKHTPRAAEDDVAMRISLPYRAQYVLD